MNRERSLYKVKRLIARKPHWKLPKTLIGDKDAYIEIFKYIRQGLSESVLPDTEIFLSNFSEEDYRDKDFVFKVFDALYSKCDSKIILRELSNHLNKNIATHLVKQNSGYFEYFCDELRDDEDIARIDVSKQWGMLEYCSDRLKDERDIVRLAVGQKGTAIYYASGNMKNNAEMGRFAVSKTGEAYRYLSDKLRDDKEITLIAVEDPKALAIQHASDRLKNDIDVAVSAVRANGKAIEYVSIENRSQHSVISEAIKHSPELIKHATRRYLYSEPLLFKAVVENSAVLEYVPEEMSKVMVDMLDKYDSANTRRNNNDREIDY